MDPTHQARTQDHYLSTANNHMLLYQQLSCKRAHTHKSFTAFCLGLPGWAGTRRNIHPLTPILIIKHPLSTSSIYYDPQHPPCSIYMLDSSFPQPLSRLSLIYLLVWNPLLRTPYISVPNHCLLFTIHAHTITTCFAVVSRLCHLFLISLVVNAYILKQQM